MMNSVTRIGFYTSIFAVGCGVGAYVDHEIAQAKAFANEMAEESRLSAQLEAQRAKGGDAAYEDALKVYLYSLDMRSRGLAPTFPDRVYATDSALTYVRLSMLASRRGAKDEADAYLKKASDLCSRIATSDCSATMLREMVARLDRGRPTN